MSGMTKMEAIRFLGLSDNSSEEDVDAAIRAAILKNHPDSGGTSGEFQKTMDARNALVRVEPSGDIILREIGLSLLAKESHDKEIERHDYADKQIEKEIKRSLSLHVSPLKRRRNTTLILAGISGLAGLVSTFTSDAVSSFRYGMFETLPAILQVSFYSLTFSFALFTLLAHNRAEHVSSTIEVLNDSFSDASECADFLSSMLSNMQSLDKSDLDSRIEYIVDKPNHEESLLNGGLDKKTIASLVEAAIRDEDDYRRMQRMRRYGPFLLVSITGAASLSLPRILRSLGADEIARIFLIRAEEHGILEKSIKGTKVTYHIPDEHKSDVTLTMDATQD
jgi:hypothetical protein